MTPDEVLTKSNLRYSTDSKKGFARKRNGKKFFYFDTKDKKIKDQETIERINGLAIPPAWKNVWISPYKNGYLQATGMDEKMRKQYRYHSLWIEMAQQKKFEHLMIFAKALPKIRTRIQKELTKKELSREKVLATVVWLLENTLIRIGNEEYEVDNNSYGLTTLKNRHVDINSDQIHFSFKGKSGVYHDVHVRSKKVARVIKKCQGLPGQDLFEYKDEKGEMQTINSTDVNEFLKELTRAEITAKDFRTWAATNLAAKIIDKTGIPESDEEIKKTITETVKQVAEHLRNRPATCRKYYIDPAIFDAYRKGYGISNIQTNKKYKTVKKVKDLSKEENRVLGLLSIFQ